MERLTEEKQIGPFASLKDKAEAVPGAFGTYDCLYAHMVAVTRLKQYEDTDLEPEEILTGKELAEVACAVNLLREYQAIGPIDHLREIAQAEKDGRLESLPPNDPLTPEELREMDGEPVWFEFDDFFGWSTIQYANSEFLATWRFGFLLWAEHGKTWAAYRRKPEERLLSSDKRLGPQRDNYPWQAWLRSRFEQAEG